MPRDVGVSFEISSLGRMGVPNSPTGGVMGEESKVCSDVCRDCDVVIASLDEANAPGLA